MEKRKGRGGKERNEKERSRKEGREREGEGVCPHFKFLATPLLRLQVEGQSLSF